MTLLTPQIFFLSMIGVVLLIDLFGKQKRKRFTYWLTQASLLSALLLTILFYLTPTTLLMHGLVIHDKAASLLQIAIYFMSILVLAIVREYLISHDIDQGNFYLLTLFSVLGMQVIAGSHHFMSLYLGIELMSLPLYALVALYRDSEKATEAAIKYFVLGAISSGLLLYGISMLYGATHALDFTSVANAIAVATHSDFMILILGLVFILAGVAFKLGVVPFHMWIPDVYEGAPLAATLFITVAPKIAAFAILYRLLSDPLLPLAVSWQQIIILLSVLSMLLGNIAAMIQTKIARLFAYSTIAHGGYMLLGVASATKEGLAAAFFYTLVYGLMSIGSFGLLAMLSKKGFEITSIDDLRGLNARRPGLALVMLLVLFSMAGIPPTVGFFAKLGVLQALIDAPQNLIWLACLAIVLAVLGSYYYLKVVKVMYFDAPTTREKIPTTSLGMLSINLIGLLLLSLGMLPTYVIDLIRSAVV